MIEIKIVNPEYRDIPILQAVLAALTGDAVAVVKQDLSPRKSQADYVAAYAATLPGATVAPNDNPAAGFTIPTLHGSVALDLDADKLNALYGDGTAGATLGDLSEAPPDFAAARGEFPNVPSIPAPSTAGAAPSSTAPAVTPGISTLSPVPPIPALPGVPSVPTVAQSVQAGLPAAPALGVDVDADGLPWDARIHSSNHERNKGDNKWRAKRNVMPQLVASVTAELRAVMAIPAGVPPVPNVPVATPTPPPLPPTTPVTAASSITTFPQFLLALTAATSAGTLTQDTILAALQAVGLPNVPMLAARPDLIPQVVARLFPGA